MRSPWWLCLLPLALQLAMVVGIDSDDADDAEEEVEEEEEEEEAPMDTDLYSEEETVLRESEDIDSSSSDVKQCLWFAMQEYNEESKDPYVFLVREVLSSSLQVTNLKEYTINVKISRSSCKKPAGDEEVCAVQEDPRLQKEEDCTFMVGALPWRGGFVVLEKQCRDA